MQHMHWMWGWWHVRRLHSEHRYVRECAQSWEHVKRLQSCVQEDTPEELCCNLREYGEPACVGEGRYQIKMHLIFGYHTTKKHHRAQPEALMFRSGIGHYHRHKVPHSVRTCCSFLCSD